MTVSCQVEPFPDVVVEIAQLVEPHWEEVGSLKDVFQRSIDYAAYHKMHQAERLMTVTARDDGRMVGYVVGVLGNDLHRVTHEDPPHRVITMSMLVYYILPTHRGHARALIRTTEAFAWARGVQIMNTRVKPGLNAADAFFAKMGYEPIEVCMTRLIGAAAHARDRSRVS